MRADINSIKILGAILIVLYHAGSWGRSFHYSGLILFCILTAALHRVPETSYCARFEKRANRLLRPWITWSIFYGLIALGLSRPIFPLGDTAIERILSSTSIHLWYLPFSFAILFCLDALKSIVKPTQLRIIFALFSASLLALTHHWRAPSLHAGEPWAQYIHALPAFMVGVAITGLHESERWRSTLWTLALGTIGAALALDYDGVGTTYIVSFLVLFALLGLQLPRYLESRANELAQVSFSVYLIHPFVIMLVRQAVSEATILGVLSVIFSFAIGLYLRRISSGLFDRLF